MIRHSFILAVATATIQAYATKLPEYEIITTGTLAQSSSGQITRVKISSHHLADELIVDVWTPEGYRHDGDVKYPTIYAHDGQNLFDSALCYGGVAWELDDLTSNLIDNDSIVAPIIVGIHNRGAKRASDYFPEKALNFIFDSDKNKTKIFETCHHCCPLKMDVVKN